MIQLVKLIFTIIFITHIFACIWLFVAQIELILNPNDPTWMDRSQINQESWFVQYSYSFYFTMVTMVTVGYGDIVPVNTIEVWVNIFIMLFACMVFAYSMNTIGIIITNFFQLSNKISDNMFIINSYMDKKGIDQSLQFQVREYLFYYWKHNSQNFQDQAIDLIQNLPESIQHTLLREANGIIFKNSEFFEQLSEQLKQKICPIIQEFQCPPGYVFFRQNEFDDSCVYFIERGEVELYFDSTNHLEEGIENHKVIKQLKQGSSFGLESFLTGSKQKFSAKSTQFCNILLIKRSDFLQKVQNFPLDQQKFCHHRDYLKNLQGFESSMKYCECCGEKTHFLDDCLRLHQKRDYYKMSLKSKSGTNERDQVFERNPKREKSKFLHKVKEILETITDFRETNSDIIEIYDSIIEEEEDYFFYKKKCEMIDSEFIQSHLNISRSNTTNNLNHNSLTTMNMIPQSSLNNIEKFNVKKLRSSNENCSNIQDDHSPIDKMSSKQIASDQQSDTSSTNKNQSFQYFLENDKFFVKKIVGEPDITLKVTSQDSQHNQKSHLPKTFHPSQIDEEISDEDSKSSLLQRRRGSISQQTDTMSPKQKNPIKRLNKRRQSQLPQHFKKLFAQPQYDNGHKKGSLDQIERISLTNLPKITKRKETHQNSIVSFKEQAQISQIQDLLHMFKSEIHQIKQNYTTNTNNWQQLSDLSNECFQEYDYYLPWNNLKNVLMKKNFKKMKQIKDIRNKRWTYLNNIYPGSVKNTQFTQKKFIGFSDYKEDDLQGSRINQQLDQSVKMLTQKDFNKSIDQISNDLDQLESEGKCHKINQSSNILNQLRLNHNSAQNSERELFQIDYIK